MKNHLKSIAVPRTWPIDRKRNVYTTRPKSGAHSFYLGMPLGTILKDFLHLTNTTREAGKMLNNNTLLVDGKRRKDSRLIVGLFDVVSIPTTNQNFRVVLDKKGRLVVHEIDAKESSLKPCKVVNKTALPKGNMQLNLYDGKNLISKEKCKVGDTLLLTVPDQKITKVLELKPGAFVFLIKGKHAGMAGQLLELKGAEAIIQIDDQKVETAKKYLFVLGDNKPAIKLME